MSWDVTLLHVHCKYARIVALLNMQARRSLYNNEYYSIKKSTLGYYITDFNFANKDIFSFSVHGKTIKYYVDNFIK